MPIFTGENGISAASEPYLHEKLNTKANRSLNSKHFSVFDTVSTRHETKKAVELCPRSTAFISKETK